MRNCEVTFRALFDFPKRDPSEKTLQIEKNENVSKKKHQKQISQDQNDESKETGKHNNLYTFPELSWLAKVRLVGENALADC